MGGDPGAGKGAITATDIENAKAIDLENEKAPDGTPAVIEEEKNVEDTEKMHENDPCFKQGDEVMTKIRVEERAAMTNKYQLWEKKNGIVHLPYIFSSSFSGDESSNIARAFQEYAKNTCIR